MKIPLALHVHHIIAANVSRIPRGVSMGIIIPTKLVATRGRRQYPNTEVERVNVKVEDKIGPPEVAGVEEGWPG